MRVLAVAQRRLSAEAGLDHHDVRDLQLLGLVAMADPPRPSAASAVAACARAGIDVKMITGDHPGTAAAIASRVGIVIGQAGVATGADLDALDDDAFSRTAADLSVFARVRPNQKLRLVRALQRQGHVVAMTGDGVNDAPALRQADLGIAMGTAGTEAAKQAADLVLTDDAFSTIRAAVEEGRAVCDNIVKFLVFALPTNTAQALIVVLGVLTGTTLPLTAVQILWINLITAVGLGLVLAVEPREPGIMTRPPRRPGSPILSRVLTVRIVLVGLALMTVAFASFHLALAAGTSETAARTVAATAFVLVEIAYLLTCRSLYRPLRRSRWFQNRWLLVGAGAVIVLQGAFTAAPVMASVFDTAWPDAAGWAVTAAATLAGSAVIWLAVIATRPAARPEP